MFIELTDHLRCPAGHPESFLVLIPDAMDARRVRAGLLGCPACGAEYRIVDGVVEFGDVPAMAAASGAAPPPPEGLVALLGIEGPGGYVALIGDAANQARALGAVLPGVHLVLVNPPPGAAAVAGTSTLRSPRLPLKARSMRGVVLGDPAAESAEWRTDAIGAALPGRHVVGTGPAPALEDFELLGSAAGWWVGRRK